MGTTEWKNNTIHSSVEEFPHLPIAAVIAVVSRQSSGDILVLLLAPIRWTTLRLFWNQQEALSWRHVIFVARLSGLFMPLTVTVIIHRRSADPCQTSTFRLESFLAPRFVSQWFIHGVGVVLERAIGEYGSCRTNGDCCVWVSPTLPKLRFLGTIKGVWLEVH